MTPLLWFVAGVMVGFLFAWFVGLVLVVRQEGRYPRRGDWRW